MQRARKRISEKRKRRKQEHELIKRKHKLKSFIKDLYIEVGTQLDQIDERRMSPDLCTDIVVSIVSNNLKSLGNKNLNLLLNNVEHLVRNHRDLYSTWWQPNQFTKLTAATLASCVEHEIIRRTILK